MRFLPYITFALFSLSSIAQSRVFHIVVAQDGSGDVTSLSSAIERLNGRRTTIFIKNGIYTEKNLINEFRTNVRLIGESVDGVIITYNDYAGKSTVSNSTAQSYTFRIEGDGFYAENITFKNTATQAQAVAVYTKGDSITFKNCKFLGYQDTHFADDGRQYFLNCEIKGDVDFIFGSAAAVFENCNIISSKRKGGYITAPSETRITSTGINGGTIKHGFLFKNCNITAEDGLADNTVYLGRPWEDNSSSVFITCTIGNHIKPSGWSVWTTDQLNQDYNNHETAFFAEFNSTDINNEVVDTSQRVSWSYQLKTSDTTNYSLQKYFKGWSPISRTKALPSPDGFTIISDSLFWLPVENALGYGIFRNDSILGFTDKTSYSVKNKINEKYTIKTLNKFYAFGNESDVATSISKKKKDEFNSSIFLSNNILFVPKNKGVTVYNVLGNKLITYAYQREIDLISLKNGLYIIQVQLTNNNILTKKILLAH